MTAATILRIEKRDLHLHGPRTGEALSQTTRGPRRRLKLPKRSLATIRGSRRTTGRCTAFGLTHCRRIVVSNLHSSGGLLALARWCESVSPISAAENRHT